MREISDDLPAFGSPMSAASAISFRCSSTSRSSPGGPTSANRGTWRVDETNRALPRPPRPPFARTTRARGCARSAIRPPSSENTWVPTGTCNSTSSPSAPYLRAPLPFSPRVALIRLRRCSAVRSRSDWSASRITSPPSPPSPPSGPPFGTNFSRRKLRPPSPPFPATTWSVARSMNIDMARTVAGRAVNPFGSGGGVGLLFHGHEAAHAARAEGDRAGAVREDGVVAPDVGAGARAEPRAALADDDVAGDDSLAAEHLHTEVFRLRVAAVLGGAEALLVCHLRVLLLRLQCRLEC